MALPLPNWHSSGHPAGHGAGSSICILAEANDPSMLANGDNMTPPVLKKNEIPCSILIGGWGQNRTADLGLMSPTL